MWTIGDDDDDDDDAGAKKSLSEECRPLSRPNSMSCALLSSRLYIGNG
jgi:hypothetical protein